MTTNSPSADQSANPNATTEVDFILGVDLDGVCGDYTAAFASVVAADRGVDPAELGPQLTWDFHEWELGGRDGFVDLHRAGVQDHRMFRNMPAIDGVSETLWRLSDAGVWIRIITHRIFINGGHKVAIADTVEWLDIHNIPYRDLCFLGHKPQVEADCYIDDGPHNVDALRAAGNHVIVFDQPYNRHLAGPRATTWAEVEEQVTALIHAKRLGQPVSA
jgi:5'-nucleotidase